MIERAIERFRESRRARRVAGEIVFHILANGIEIGGSENLPQPPYIVAINHMAWAEGPVLSLYLPHLPHPMTKAENFEMKGIGFIARKMGYFPVRRGEPDMSAIKTALHLLREGEVLVIPPEGTRGRDKERTVLKEAKAGIIYLARKAKVPIVPIALWGTEDILPLIEEEGVSFSEILSLLSPFGKEKIYVRIGEPFEEHFSLPEEPLNSEMMMPYAHRLMIRIRDLLPPKYHGYYADWEQEEG